MSSMSNASSETSARLPAPQHGRSLRFDPAESPRAVTIWREVVAAKYARFERVLVESAERHSEQLWHELSLPDDGLAVDVGCGFGDTSARLAQQTRGRVVGIDCTAPLLDLAKARYAELTNLSFVLADAGAFTPDAPVDLCFSRFGLTFFERPVQTLRRIRSWMRPGSRLGTLVWHQRQRNPWLELARDLVLRHVPPVDDGAPTCGPGPFSMQDRETATAIFEAAGFRDLRFRALEASVWIGGNAREAAEFQLAMGPAGEIMRHAEASGHAGIAAASAEVLAELERHETPAGVFLPSTSWWIDARA